ncbi:P-loop containing nucleoside triphosphate hydrolase protein [Butyriboletus roseoflavus]|nr:P-loop containing nucleoside triphosphate hydrolase protein [Butyriboletus roseoflavus]
MLPVCRQRCFNPHLSLSRSFSLSSSILADIQRAIDTAQFPCDSIRNFSIIAHIDHGKSTLADRLLELTGTIPKKTFGSNQQVLDKLKVERERGITVKAQTASMMHAVNSKKYLLNLIDTPGHVDFSWEVSRSLAASQGALLLVDATQGVQAQSISVFHIAKERGLTIIPVLNKIDMPASQPERVALQLQSTFGVDPVDVLQISAKTGQGVEAVLRAIVERIPPPSASVERPLKALLFDSHYDRYRGVISLVSLHNGTIRKGDKIASCHTRKKYEVQEVGIMHPEELPTASLRPGQVGYIACNMKESSEAYVGDTLYRVGAPVDPMPGFRPAKAMVYAGIFPVDTNDFIKLEESVKRLTLTDRSVSVQRESSSALGQGCRLGFLGTLHMDVFRQRLEDEYDANIIVTAPTVPYKVIYKDKIVFVSNPTEFPELSDSSSGVKEVQEPVVKATIIVPEDYLGEMMELCFAHRAEDLDHRYLDAGATKSACIILTCTVPLSEIVTDFFDKLKSKSSGYASFDYENVGYKQSNLSKMVFLLNGKPVDALALIVHRSAQQEVGRTWVKKLHKVIPRQLFEVPIQAAIGKKIIARETLKALRADVTAGLYGGHYERKMKHLENQKESKRRMKRIGSVDLPQEAFFDILSTKAK